ncbi:MAG: DUF222 domain-containing protein [Leucobacter sp.]|nr:DUF222 domain-containing protein [Leucobacter sp.]
MTSPLEIRTGAIAGLADVAREIQSAEARRLKLLARGYRALPPGEMAFRAFKAEAALALNITDYRVDQLLGIATALENDYLDTASLLSDGRIGVAHAEVIITAGHVITNIVATGVDEAARKLAEEMGTLAAARLKEYEHAVLAFALEETPNRLKPIAKRLAEQWAVEPIEARQAAETARRRVTVVEMSDGMAELRAYMPAVLAYGLHDHLTRIAKAVRRKTVPAPPVPLSSVATGATPEEALAESLTSESTDARSIDEIRTDALYDLLSRDPFVASESAPRPVGAELQGRVQLVVTAEGLDSLLAKHGGTVVRDTELPPSGSVKCELQGYGPVDIDAAGPFIASRKHWDLITVCSHTGEVIRTDTYRPAMAQERFLVARDGHCRFPGCVAPTHRSEIDHTLDAALGGPTATDNLAHLCLRHHTLKGNTDWAVEQVAGGVLIWTSPTGRVYTDRPPDRLPESRVAHASQRRRVRFEPDAHPF